MALRHEGYVGPAWDRAWVVIGGVGGDPVIGDTSRRGTPVMLALHGTGHWRPHDVAPDPATFLAVVATWLEVLARFEGQRLDASRDFEVKAGFDEMLASRLQSVVPEDCGANLLAYLST